MDEPNRAQPTESESESSEDMARADVANGERPEQPVSGEHAAYERRRTGKHPVGEEQAETNRSEESPS